jgi:hypothetical protein
MKDIQKRELIRAIDLIKALGCAYKVITPDGVEFGDLRVIAPKTIHRAARKHPYGMVVAHVRKHLDMSAAIGVVQVIACGELDPEVVRSSICTVLTAAWGKDTYTTATQPGTVEVMRTAAGAV